MEKPDFSKFQQAALKSVASNVQAIDGSHPYQVDLVVVLKKSPTLKRAPSLVSEVKEMAEANGVNWSTTRFVPAAKSAAIIFENAIVAEVVPVHEDPADKPQD